MKKTSHALGESICVSVEMQKKKSFFTCKNKCTQQMYYLVSILFEKKFRLPTVLQLFTSEFLFKLIVFFLFNLDYSVNPRLRYTILTILQKIHEKKSFRFDLCALYLCTRVCMFTNKQMYPQTYPSSRAAEVKRMNKCHT